MQFVNSNGRNKTQVVDVSPPTPELIKEKDGIVETTNITTVPSRTTVTDLSRIPKRHLLQYTSGSPWVVDYYRRLSGMNDPKQFFDPAVDNATQQFERIVGQVLRVGSALSWNQDSGTKSLRSQVKRRCRTLSSQPRVMCLLRTWVITVGLSLRLIPLPV